MKKINNKVISKRIIDFWCYDKLCMTYQFSEKLNDPNLIFYNNSFNYRKLIKDLKFGRPITLMITNLMHVILQKWKNRRVTTIIKEYWNIYAMQNKTVLTENLIRLNNWMWICIFLTWTIINLLGMNFKAVLLLIHKKHLHFLWFRKFVIK